MIQTATSFLQGFFLNPLGLLALFALIPLLIFYLTRPEPERKVMPSMEFFSEDQEDSMLQNAIKKLSSNLILLINIFALILMTAAVAGLYFEGSGQEKSVVVYDRSASMYEEHAEAVSTVQSYSASEVTLVEVADTVEVHEGFNRQDTVDFIRDNPPKYFDGDLGAALQEAQQYEGEIVLLSNLDESESVVDDYRSLGVDRGLNQISYSTDNSWGFTSIGEDYVEIRNYGESSVSTRLSVNDVSQDIELEAQSTNRINVNLSSGENRLELPNDGFSPDNKAYIYVPEDEKLGLEYHGPENSYLDTALDLIEGVEKTENDGEVVILNVENEDLYNDDRPKILMQGASNLWEIDSSEETVEFEVVDSRIESEVFDLNSSETSFASPSKALFVEEDTVYYNFEDDKIRRNIAYPVLWKNIIEAVSEPPNFENSNTDIRFSEFDEPGFYGNQAVNFLDSHQAQTNYNSIEQDIESSRNQISQASVIALLALLLLTGETLILLKKGVYQ